MSEIVEALTAQQIEQVRNLFREYRSELPLPLCFGEFDEELRHLPGSYRQPGGRLLLATVAGQPVGCVGLSPYPAANTCEMRRLFVRPSFRGARLGYSLADRIMQTGRNLGYLYLRVDTHPPTMAAAVDLYRKLGFQAIPAEPLTAVPGLLYMQIRL
jgi:GNAT superfamily N-acetyltransferase